MWRDIKRLYADSAAFALALPILFSIPGAGGCGANPVA